MRSILKPVFYLLFISITASCGLVLRPVGQMEYDITTLDYTLSTAHRTSVALTEIDVFAVNAYTSYELSSAPSSGEVSRNGSTYYYTPDDDFSGADSFTVRFTNSILNEQTFVSFEVEVSQGIYFNHDCDTLESRAWDNAANWWHDADCTEAANRIPVDGDFVYISGLTEAVQITTGSLIGGSGAPYPGPTTPITLAGFDTTGFYGDFSYFGGSAVTTNITIQSNGSYYIGYTQNMSSRGSYYPANIRNTWRGQTEDGSVKANFIGGAACYLGDHEGVFTFSNYSNNQDCNLTGNATFNDDSYNSFLGTIRGDVIFNDDSKNAGSIFGNANFNDDSMNAHYANSYVVGSVSRRASFNGSSPARGLLVSCTGDSCPTNPNLLGFLFYCDQGTSLWNDSDNWFTDVDCTQPAGRTPQNGDSVVALEYYSDTPPALSLAELYILAANVASATTNLSIDTNGTLHSTMGRWYGGGLSDSTVNAILYNTNLSSMTVEADLTAYDGTFSNVVFNGNVNDIYAHYSNGAINGDLTSERGLFSGTDINGTAIIINPLNISPTTDLNGTATIDTGLLTRNPRAPRVYGTLNIVGDSSSYYIQYPTAYSGGVINVYNSAELSRLTVNSGGTVNLYNDAVVSSYATINSGGEVYFNDNSSIENVTFTVNSGGLATFNDNSSHTGAISGTGTVTCNTTGYCVSQ